MCKKYNKIDYSEKECKICHQIKPISGFYSRTYKTCKRCVCKINSDKSYKRHLLNNPDLQNEIWKDVIGYKGLYKISNFGRVRSFVLGGNNGCILLQSTHKQGYKRIRLSDGNSSLSYLVHRLVAIAFIPNPDNKETVNHLDGNKANNSVENLEWATQSENNKHAFRTGLKRFTDKNQEASTRGHKVNKSQVIDIRNEFSNGKSLLNLSLEYSISKAQVCRIVNHKSRISV